MDRVVHFEIPADDLNRAKKFYATTFGWKLEDYPEMDYVMAVTTEKQESGQRFGAINGGLTKSSGIVKKPSFAIEVDDIDTALENVKKNGGKIIREKMAVEKDTMAYFEDTEGNMLSVWQSAKEKLNSPD